MKDLNGARVLVVGASRGTGLAVVEALLERMCHVTAFARHASAMTLRHERLAHFDGDATNPEDIDRAVAGHDAVIVTLGISENPLSVRWRNAAKSTSLEVRSQGTRHVIEAMRRHGVRRLIVQTTYGITDSEDRLGLMDRLFFWLILKPQIADTIVQEELVQRSDLDWVIAKPVHLTDEATQAPANISTEGVARRMKVARAQVARVLADAIWRPEVVRERLSISG